MNDFNINSILSIISHTPAWVWGILAYLLFVGIQALRPRMVSLNRLIILPLILLALKYRIFTSADVWVYLVGVAVGLTAGYLQARNAPVKIFKSFKSILIPGSSSLIVVLLGIFAMNYYFAYLKAVDQNAYFRLLYWDYGLSGLLTGYFAGQRASYLRRYFQTNENNSL